MASYYFDTSIWRDYYENRSDKFRPLGEWALALINQIIKEESIIFYSDFVVTELKASYTEEQIKKIFEIFEKHRLLIKANTHDCQIKEAAKLSREKEVSFGDALHSVIARDNNAVLVTRDKHFEDLNNIVTVKKPEELI